MMSYTRQFIKEYQKIHLSGAFAKIKYTGFVYAQSQWTGLLQVHEAHKSPAIDIGLISIRLRGRFLLSEFELMLLNMAMNYGAHLVTINYLDSLTYRSPDEIRFKHTVQINALCKRLVE